MKRKVLIFGVSDFAEILYSYLKSDSTDEYDICGFVVEKKLRQPNHTDHAHKMI